MIILHSKFWAIKQIPIFIELRKYNFSFSPDIAFLSDELIEGLGGTKWTNVLHLIRKEHI